MDSLEQLAEIRDRTLRTVELRRKDPDRIRVIVGMGTPGIAAGARTVLQNIVDTVASRQLSDVVVEQSADLDEQGMEPVVEVVLAPGTTVRYVKVKPEMVARIVTDTVERGQVIEEFTT